jgi:hypothetical protein
VTRLNDARLTGSATGWEHFNSEHAPPVSIDQQMSVWTDGRSMMVAGVIAKLPNVVSDLEQSATECEGVRSDVVIWVHGFSKILNAPVELREPSCRDLLSPHSALDEAERPPTDRNEQNGYPHKRGYQSVAPINQSP